MKRGEGLKMSDKEFREYEELVMLAVEAIKLEDKKLLDELKDH